MQDNENQTQYVDPYTPYGCTHQRNKPNDSDKDLENLLNGYINRDSDISRILYILTKNSVGGALNLEISDLREAVAELEDIINNKANTSDIEDLDQNIDDLNTVIEGLRSAIDALSTTVDGKANSSDLQALNESLTNLSEQLSALSSTVAGKADASDIVAPSWGNITGTLSSQTDLKDALDGKADASDLQALNTTVDSKASTSDLQALSSVLVSLINEKADQIALDALSTTVAGKATPVHFTITLSVSDWLGNKGPFSQIVMVSGLLSTDAPITDVVLSSDTTTSREERKSWSYVSRIICADGMMAVMCDDYKPTVNMTIQMLAIRGG